MKAIKDPVQETFGMCYLPQLTDEFEKLIETAKDKIKPFSQKETSQYTYYFKVKGEEVSSEFDCCDDTSCIRRAKKDVRAQYGKGTHVEECYYYNDGDHERIEICSVCDKPLNEWLTWCGSELEYLEQSKPWDVEFLKGEVFLICCILNSTPTMDRAISGYAKHQGGEILTKALEDREKFFQRIVLLAQTIIDANIDA